MGTDFGQLNKQIIACHKCPRLVAWREEVARTKRRAYQDWDYWGKPVPGFGDPKARVLVVGLAPGAHGSNRTGRQFTGDASGQFLYPALYRAGFASQPNAASRDDGLILRDMYITASVRCAPPDNKPTSEELNNCQPFLERELEIIKPKVIVVLGRIAFERIVRIYFQTTTDHKPQAAVHRPSFMVFSHGALYKLNTDWLLCSYHPSQQNTSTGKLTVKMFDAIWSKARELIHDKTSSAG
ncbi:MAG: uracil-DNA glycosylase [Chloroflexi bacterium]|nr:uracil-DNA glycosylase [Chloroflexota bacterium]